MPDDTVLQLIIIAAKELVDENALRLAEYKQSLAKMNELLSQEAVLQRKTAIVSIAHHGIYCHAGPDRHIG